MICSLCPRKCNILRDAAHHGYCLSPEEITLSRAALHFWEEPCISGENGSGTVFFSGCNLRCVFCQNRKISDGSVGKSVSCARLCEIFLELQEKGAHNINLVTPTHYSDKIAVAIDIARENGLTIPFVYNCGGYESTDSLKALNGKIDIYMPDFKYVSPLLSQKYSGAKDYFSVARKALFEMVYQQPIAQFKDGIMQKGVLVRHMLLPGYTEDSKRVLRFLHESFGDSIYISIMNQYTPLNPDYPEIYRSVTKEEYEDVIDFAVKLGIKNAFIQEGGTVGESFIPDFNFEGI